MRRIKHTLTERYYLWQDANDVAKSDPEIDLAAANGKVYKPMEHDDEVPEPDSWPMPGTSGDGNAVDSQRPKAEKQETS